MDKASPNTLSSFFSLPHLVEFLFLHTTGRISTCEKFLCSFLSFFQPQVCKSIVKESMVRSEGKNPIPETGPNPRSSNSEIDARLRRDDVEMVMHTLGIFFTGENENINDIRECFALDRISVLFENEEPSLDEVMAAFQVFDQKRDGFIDAEELQRVLQILGFREASNFSLSEMMIKAFDENGDGRIDFKEFVKLMEKGFC